jgi:hypothetical protein
MYLEGMTMISRNLLGLAAVFAGLCVALTTGPATAVPITMTEQEMFDQSDVVATVRVVATVCTGWIDDVGPWKGQRMCLYRSELRILEVKKGSVCKGQHVWVEWHDPFPPGHPLRSRSIYYFLGEEVTTHLVRRKEQGLYRSGCVDAKRNQARKPITFKLPAHPGETLRVEDFECIDES